MSLPRVTALLSAVLLPITLATQTFAQDGTLHGAAIVARPGGGCYLTSSGQRVPNPFVDPGVSGAISCVGNFSNLVAYQGTTATATNVGTVQGSPDFYNFKDNLGNTYSMAATASTYSYCGGDSCYPAAPNDGATRLVFNQLNLQNLVKAVNAKEKPSQNLGFRVAYAYTGDGYTTAFTIEGGNLMLEMKKDETRWFEIFPSTPGLVDNFSDQALAPYKFTLVAPDLQTTPHKENVPGISTEVQFDKALKKWRYYIFVDGSMLPSIGKYLVVPKLVRSAPHMIGFRYATEQDNQRYCNPTTRCQRAIYLESMFTLTVAYGTEQCFKQQGLPLPSMNPLLDSYLGMISHMKKGYKSAFKLLNKLPPQNRVRLGARKFRNDLKNSEKFIAEHRAFEVAGLKGFTEIYTAEELGSLAENLKNRALQTITVGKKYKFSSRAISRRFFRALGAYLGGKPKTGQRAGNPKKYQKQIKGDIAKIDSAYNNYRTEMDAALARDRELRQNSQICGEAF